MQSSRPDGSIPSRARRVLYEEGGRVLLKKGFLLLYEDYLRPRLPKGEKTVNFNGISAKTGDVCIFDRIVPFFDPPWYNFDVPDYEQPLIEALTSSVSRGDTVVIVGGGWGVTAVVAARLVGDSGEVYVFEGAADRIPDIKGTLALNDVRDRVSIRHAIVGDPVALSGEAGDPDFVNPTELPQADVLEMDCEGSETGIIPNLENKPGYLIVETHRNESTVKEQLSEIGYQVINRGVEKEDEIFILTCRREGTLFEASENTS